ncbi:MAG: hypothetical protein AAGF28_12400 [Pseudomonadota bacterium]
MIIFLTTRGNHNTMRKIASDIGRSVFKCRDYGWLLSKKHVPAATYIFSDMERLSTKELQAVAAIYKCLERSGARVLNDPAKVKVRYALLHHLHEKGLNPFQCYHADTRPKPKRFPVFARNDNDHAAPLSDLLASQDELDRFLDDMIDRGIPLNGVLITEFCARPIREGAYKKHSVFRVANAYLSHPPVAQDHWCVKYGTPNFQNDEQLDESIAEMRDNPFADAMIPYFETAQIDFGRSDFGLTDEGIALYEINTNPDIKVVRKHRYPPLVAAVEESYSRILEAIRGLDSSSGPPIEISIPQKRVWRFEHPFRRRLRTH